MQVTYFPTSQCSDTCSCSCWEPGSLTQAHWDDACVRLHTWKAGNRESPCGPKPPLNPNCVAALGSSYAPIPAEVASIVPFF